VLVNDFEAVAYAVGACADDQFRHLCGPDQPLPDRGTISVLGPGTGLGVGLLVKNGGNDWLNVRDYGREPRRDELGRVEHAEEPHACRPEPNHYDQDPGGTTDRYRTMKKGSERNQANPGERGAQGRKGEMRRKIQADGDERKAGSPKHHDSQKAQGGTDAHCSSIKLRPFAEIWQMLSQCIRVQHRCLDADQCRSCKDILRRELSAVRQVERAVE
jgi:hypothetical protein